VWEQMCGDLGLAGIHIPEAYGGLGFGMVELGIVMEEMGQALYCSPYFASAVLAANVILLGADERHRELLLPGIAAGTRIATLAVTEPDGRWDEGGITLTARPAADGFTLDGTKKFVLDGCIANTVIVAARLAAGGIALLLVDGDAEGLTRRSLNTLDDTRKLAELNFSGVQATLLGPPTEASAALARGGDLSTIALANEMVGGAQALLDSAVDYAQMRMQFGRLIGSFQSIKHKCAEMLLDVELAKSAAYYAAEAAAEDDPELPALASLSKALASEVYMATAAECIQIHGGIGFTWDQDTHLWFKRAKSSEVFLGDANFHRERYIQCLEATA